MHVVALSGVVAALLTGLEPGVGSAATAPWSIARTPNPHARNGSLASISCTSTTVCVAVGNHVNLSGLQHGLAEVWNGTRWTVTSVHTPKHGLAATLFGVSCASATDCVAVGAWVNNGPYEVTLAEHWNGTSWSVTPSPNAGADQRMLLAVSCASATFCAAVGSYFTVSNTVQTLAEHWDGSTWSLDPTPNPSGATYSRLAGVSCVSATDCEAVGSSDANQVLAEHWNGSGWSLQTVALPSGASNSSLAAVSCTSATACIAVGGACVPPAQCNVVGGGPTSPLAERWNGTSWAGAAPVAPSGVSAAYLDGVSCATASACAAVGFSTTDFGGTVTLAENWNGTSWSQQTTPNAAGSIFNSLEAVSCASATSCISAGGVNYSGTLAEQLSGTSWSLLHAADPGGTLGGELASVACASSTACTAVGGSLIEAWNGTSWSIQRPAEPVGFRGVSCSLATACTAVGGYLSGVGADRSLAQRWDGSAWSVQSTADPSTSGNVDLSAVSCPSATSCIAVGMFETSSSYCLGPGAGDSPLAEEWDGTAWSLSSVPAPSGAVCVALTGVSCTSATQCFGVGSYTDSANNSFTLVERWNGTAWSIVAGTDPGGGSNQLNAVSCASATLCVAVGVSGFQSLAELWNGTSWSVQSLPSGCCALTGVSCRSTTSCLAVGGHIAERWDGLTWAFSQPVFPKKAIDYSIVADSCASATACTAVGHGLDVLIPAPVLSSGGGIPSTGGGGTPVTLAETYSG